MNYGYQNEYDFVELFNNKYFSQLDENSKNFLTDLFPLTIDDSEKIRCWKNKMVQKTDIFIKFKNYVKNVSLKCGNSNSVHHEQIQEFKRYLGNIDFSKRLSSEEYKLFHQNDLDMFNNEINKTRLIVDMIDRFIVRGRNSDYDIDVLICGTVNDYVWIKKYDLYDLILSKRCLDFTSPHVACMTIGPKKRNINGDSKNDKDRYIVCVRWNFIKEHIINFKKNKL